MRTVPTRLYKYFGLADTGPGYDAKTDFSRKAVEERQLFLAPINKFNDPLEFRFRTATLEDTDPMQWVKALEKLSDVNLEWSDRDHGIRARVATTNPKAFEERVARAPSVLRAWLEVRCGVLCMTEDAANLLMWAHYAACHRGFCLEFSTSFDPFQGAVQPVQYQELMPVLDPFTYNPDTFVDSILLGKSTHWSYEREWRRVEHNVEDPLDAERWDEDDLPPSPRILHYPAKALTGIITGCQFPETRRADLESWLTKAGSEPIRYRSVLSETDYAVRIERV